MSRRSMFVVGSGVVLGLLWVMSPLSTGHAGSSARAADRSGRTDRHPDVQREHEHSKQLARAQFDVFELVTTSALLPGINLDAIGADHATPTDVLERLTAFGKASLLTRIDDRVAWPGESEITVGHRTPSVQDIVVSKDGKVTPSVSYEDVGAIANLSGEWIEHGETPLARVALKIEFSRIGESSVTLTNGVTLPQFIQAQIEKTLLTRSGEPTLTLANLMAAPTDESETLTVYVVRTVMTHLEP